MLLCFALPFCAMPPCFRNRGQDGLFIGDALAAQDGRVVRKPPLPAALATALVVPRPIPSCSLKHNAARSERRTPDR